MPSPAAQNGDTYRPGSTYVANRSRRASPTLTLENDANQTATIIT